jgi:hypothetical protein
MIMPFIEVVEKRTYSCGVKTTTHYREELKNEPQQFIKWSALPGKTVFRTFFFDGRVNK